MKLTKKQLETQGMCDLEKWNKSVKEGKDMSGIMPWCKGCKYAIDELCSISHEDREDVAACGKNYLKLCKEC